MKRCSIITILGPTNAGKSTLINALIGEKISVVTHKVQTTRSVIRGIICHENAQLIFVDTPGIFSPATSLEKMMVNTAWDACCNTEVSMLVLDSTKGITKNVKDIIGKLQSPAVAVLNKVDLLQKEKLLILSSELNALFEFDYTFMVSSLKKSGVQDIKQYLARTAQVGPWVYPSNEVTDAPLRFLLSEITREKLFLRVHKEIPYRIIVETEMIEEVDEGLIISQVIYVVSKNHKKIILGNGGSTIKDIKNNACYEMYQKTEKKISLNLFVKVRKEWHANPNIISNIGY